MEYIFEIAICDFCNSSESLLLYEKKGLLCEHVFYVVKCKTCGLFYVSPRLTFECVSSLYNVRYYGSVENKGVDDYWDTERKRYEKAEYIYNIINSVRSFKKEDNILDIGCGKGDLIKYLYNNGYKAEGVETSEFACRQLDKQGIICYQGDISSQNLKGRKYDVIVSTDVIEHVYSPMLFFKMAYSMLNSNGVFLCTTDMADYFFDREGENWKQITPDVHIYYFSRKSYQKYFKKCGFITADQYNYYINYNRRINRYLFKAGLLKNNRPITLMEKFMNRYILKALDKILNLTNDKPMKLWNIPLMRKIDL